MTPPRKLTDDEIREIRRLERLYPRRIIAKKYGISITTVKRIVEGFIYKDVKND